MTLPGEFPEGAGRARKSMRKMQSKKRRSIFAGILCAVLIAAMVIPLVLSAAV
jgi:hypothetical protein